MKQTAVNNKSPSFEQLQKINLLYPTITIPYHNTPIALLIIYSPSTIPSIPLPQKNSNDTGSLFFLGLTNLIHTLTPLRHLSLLNELPSRLFVSLLFMLGKLTRHGLRNDPLLALIEVLLAALDSLGQRERPFPYGVLKVFNFGRIPKVDEILKSAALREVLLVSLAK
jgi:hypothetical protein